MKTSAPENELERLEALKAYQILDTGSEQDFDDLARLATLVCDTPIALVSLVDKNRVWYKSRIGMAEPETPREHAFCSVAIKQPDVFVVGDALKHATFKDSPIVLSGPRLRFYAAAPLITNGGEALGTLCVADTKPRELSAHQKEALKALSRQVMAQLELRRNILALRDSQSQYRNFVNTAHDLIYTTDEQGRFTFFNPTAETLLGYKQSELIGKPYLDLIAPEYRDNAKVFYTSQLHNRTSNTYYEFPSFRKDGTVVWFGQHVQLLRKGERVLGFQALARDITDRKIAEEQLADALIRLKNVFDAATQVSIIATDVKGVISVFNSGAQRMLGYSAEEIIGKRTPITFHLDTEIQRRGEELSALAGRSIEGFDAIVEPARRNGYEQREWTYIKKGRSQITVDLSVTPLRDVHENMIGFLGIAKDITLAKQAQGELNNAKELAESANKAKSSFLANMSHEIRTPMNGIIGMTDLLMNTSMTSEQRDYLNTIRMSSESLLNIINDILDFSKIESGKMDLEQEPFELRECIEDAFEMVSPKARERGNEMMYVMEANVPPRIIGDVTRLRQILVNLVSNAVKFTGGGEILLSVQKQAGTRERSELLFSIKDTGIGIPKDKLESIFEAFTQADSSVTRKYGGSGLGLVICARLVALMGGKIWVESTEGEGSKFFFTITAAPAPGLTNTPPSAILPELEGKRVLIVDDNRTNLRVFAEQCKQWGMVCHTSLSPEEALRWIRNNEHFDAAILDMQMPFMDGVALALEIQSIGTTKTLPLLLLSSMDLDTERIKSHRGLFVATVLKPLKMAHLLTLMKSIFLKPASKSVASAGGNTLKTEFASKYPVSILVAEDNLINQRLIQRMLKSMGYEPVTVSTGVEVLETLEKRSFDLIFMDVQMPEMDGLEATQKINAKYGTTGKPTIIAMTAFALAGDKERCLQAGMDDYVSKPFVSEQILALIEKWARQRLIKQGNPMDHEQNGQKEIDPDIRIRLSQLEAETDRDFVREIVGIYLNEAPPNFQRMKDALKATDAKTVELVAHKLKGGSVNLGATRMSKLLEKLEDLARKGTLSSIDALIQDVDEEHGSMMHTLREYCT